jgi:hypothetical protein
MSATNLFRNLANMAQRHEMPRLFRICTALALATLVLLAMGLSDAAATGNRTTWRPPPILGMKDNILFMKRIDDWQVTCYRRTYIAPVNDACELRLHEKQFATGHREAVFTFNLVIEAAPPQNPADGYDFNIMLEADPTPSWKDATIRIGEFQMRIEDVCLVGSCILRHQAARRLVEEMIEAKSPGAVISFQDAPLTESFMDRRIGLPLEHFDQAINLLIEQTQIYSGY